MDTTTSSKNPTILRNTSGNTAMLFGLMLVPIFILMGFAIDFQRSQNALRALQVTVDASALAGGRYMQTSDLSSADITAKVSQLFHEELKSAHKDVNCPNPDVTIDYEEFKITVSSECTLPTTTAGLIGKSTMKVGTFAEVLPSRSKLEVAFMIDVSGSMSGQRIADLKVAMHDAIDNLISGVNSNFPTRIALAPYSTSLNAASFAPAAVGPAYDPDRSNPNCVTERTGMAKKRDDAPGPQKYVGYEEANCPNDEIFPLSADATELKNRITALNAGGNTAGQLGIAWTWYMLSPNWNAVWPDESDAYDYDEPGIVKVAILMTDGAFNTAYDNTQGNSVMQAKRLCDSMKDNGVLIYSVAFQAPFNGKDILEKCASSESTFFEPETGAELAEVYQKIAGSLTELQITR